MERQRSWTQLRGPLTEVGPLGKVPGASVPFVGEAAAGASAVGSSPDGHPPGGVIDPGGAPAAIQKRHHCCKAPLDYPSRAMALSSSCHRSMKRRARSAGSFRLVIHFSFPDAIWPAQNCSGVLPSRPSYRTASLLLTWICLAFSVPLLQSSTSRRPL